MCSVSEGEVDFWDYFPPYVVPVKKDSYGILVKAAL